MWLTLTDFVEVMDYFGGDEEDVHSYTGESMIIAPVNAKITGIDIINENHQV